jgi:hypothetical protein
MEKIYIQKRKTDYISNANKGYKIEDNICLPNTSCTYRVTKDVK